MRYSLLFLLTLCLSSTISVAQNAKRDTASHKNDSLRNAALDKQSLELQRLKLAHAEDSLRKVQLQTELASLKSTDNLKKAELLSELKSIRSTDSLRRLNQRRQVDSLKRFVKGFPVKPFFDTLFVVYSKQGSFTAEERAAAIAGRI
ncbi:MAG: mechanosensitive ion channel family protein, partial [Sphingobacteriaceae bacterium]